MITIDNAIYAQQKCFNAIQQAGVKVERILKEAKAEGAVEKYELTIEPYNNGYELTIKTKENRDASDELYRKFRQVTRVGVISIQPSSFFHKYLEEGKGCSRIEYKTFARSAQMQGYKTVQIFEINDIEMACIEFVESIKLGGL